jgi:hypothetical protein
MDATIFDVFAAYEVVTGPFFIPAIAVLAIGDQAT